jgi:hypothetical protein
MIDEPVVIAADKPLRLSPDTMRALKKATGHSMSELLNDEDDEANRIQVMAFAELHRRQARLGHLPDACRLWEEAGMVDIEFRAPEPIDPLDAGSSPTSLLSAATGE